MYVFILSPSTLNRETAPTAALLLLSTVYSTDSLLRLTPSSTQAEQSLCFMLLLSSIQYFYNPRNYCKELLIYGVNLEALLNLSLQFCLLI